MFMTIILCALFILLGGTQVEQQQQLNSQDQERQFESCNQTFVSLAEFEAKIELQQRQIESLQRETESLQRELKYWQNTTLEILKKYIFDNIGGNSQHCPAGDNSFIKDGIEELNKQIGEIFNHTKEVDKRLTSIEDKIESTSNEDSFIKDQLQEFDQQIHRLYNQTQDTDLDIKLSNISIQLTNIEDDIEHVEQEISNPTLGSYLNPVSSCKIIPQGSPSGHYWIQQTGTGYANLEYCDMTRRCCNSTGGWMSVANLNMTDTTQNCPSGFRLITSPKRTCGTPGSSCVSTIFPLNGVKYSSVCGKIIGYQLGWPNAFGPYYNRAPTIDGSYVDGVSLTHGQTPRKHIWTFAATIDENRSDRYVCSCTRTTTIYTGKVPPFIGQDYFCDTGSRYYVRDYQFYSADPLWDGSGCCSTSSCRGFNNPPWFCKQLPQPTTDDIEMRVCVNEATSNEDVALETVEIYVQ